MKYMGSKNRIAKYILPIMLNDRKDGQYWVEPFVGGANTIDKVDGKRIGCDNNKYLIAMFHGLQRGRSRPNKISKEYYSDVRNCYNTKTTKYDNFTIGWVGFMASANGRFFEGGYSGISNTKTGKQRDYISESIRNINKQLPYIDNIEFLYCDYTELQIPQYSIIYCDIPYKNSKKYATSTNFDYDKFWNWARNMYKLGHTIYVSEYEAPSDFRCIWAKEVKSSISANNKFGGSRNSIEKLFTI